MDKLSFKLLKFFFVIFILSKSNDIISAFIIECLLQEGHSTSIFIFVQAAQTISTLLSITDEPQ